MNWIRFLLYFAAFFLSQSGIKFYHQNLIGHQILPTCKNTALRNVAYCICIRNIYIYIFRNTIFFVRQKKISYGLVYTKYKYIYFSVTGRFAHGQFAREQFAHGQFAQRTIRPQTIHPTDNSIINIAFS